MMYTRSPPKTPVLQAEYRYCHKDGFQKPLRAHHCRACGTVSTSVVCLHWTTLRHRIPCESTALFYSALADQGIEPPLFLNPVWLFFCDRGRWLTRRSTLLYLYISLLAFFSLSLSPFFGRFLRDTRAESHRSIITISIIYHQHHYPHHHNHHHHHHHHHFCFFHYLLVCKCPLSQKDS